jgi:hypothetical protein
MTATCSPALAAPSASKPAAHVVYDKSSKIGSLTVLQGLLPGHQYSIRVSSTGHVAFTSTGFQRFVYVANRRPIEDTRPLPLKGKTPYSYTLKQPIPLTFKQWQIGVTVSLVARKTLTVKVVDLGKR